MERTESTLTGFLWCLLAAIVAPVVVVSADLLVSQWLFHGQSSHNTGPAFVIGIVLGGWFLTRPPLGWGIRVLCLVIYVPLAWALLIPYSLWMLAVVFHGMVSGG